MTTGDGPPLILLPGLAPDNKVPEGLLRRLEEQLMRAFADRFTVHWTARPSVLTAGATVQQFADQVAKEIADTLPGRSIVLGISTGGSIAQQLAADHPDQVRRLALVSTGCRPARPSLTTQRRMISLAGRNNPRRALAAFARELVPRWRGRNLAAVLMCLFGLRLYPNACQMSDFEITLRAEERFDLSTLPVITAPTMIVNGGRDRFYTRAIIDETAQLIPGSRLSIYPHRGHITVTADRDALRETREFLSD